VLNCSRGDGIRNCPQCFKKLWERKNEWRMSLSRHRGIQCVVVFVAHKSAVIEIDCYRVLRELSDYLEADLPPQLRLEIETHLRECDHCTAVYDGMRNVVRLLGDEKAIELPEGFSERLYKRIVSDA
jgi:hypothetical protein